MLLVAFLTVSISPAGSQQLPSLSSSSSTAEQLVQEAMGQYQVGDYAAAQFLLEEAINKFKVEERRLEQVISWGNLSLIHQQKGDLPTAAAALGQSIELLEELGTVWRSPLTDNPHPAITARLLNISGRLSYVQGNPAAALGDWELAGQLYERLQQSSTDPEKALKYRQQLMTSKLNQVQALQSSGRHLRSCTVLANALSLDKPAKPTDTTPLLDCQNSSGGPSFTEEEPNFRALRDRVDTAFSRDDLSTAQRTSVWQSLGEVLRVLGRLEDSRKVLKAGLTIATDFTMPDTVAVTIPDTVAVSAKQFQNENITDPLTPESDEEPTPLVQNRPRLTPLYISLGNTLTAMGELERDRKNTLYEDAKFLGAEFGCFSQGERNNGTVLNSTSGAGSLLPSASENNSFIDNDDSDDTIAELYQRAARCYTDAIRTEEGNRSVLMDLKIQLNWLNLSIAHLKWLLEDSSSLITSSEDNKTTEVDKERTKFLIQEQTKKVQTQISQVDCMRSRIDQLPISQAKIYAQLNLSRNLMTYLNLTDPITGRPITQQLPQPSRIENILANPPSTIHPACKESQPIAALSELSSIRDNDLTSMSGQRLWGDIAALLTAAERDSQALYQHWTDAQLDSTAEETLSRQLVGNRRLESQAIGNLGYLYETLGSKYAASVGTLGSPAIAVSESLFQQAQAYTVKALEFAQPDKAPDIAYRWQWQLGRLLKRQGDANRETAIDVYQTAVSTLDKARKNLSTIDSEAQFSFRDNVEPVYRELMELLLRPEAGKEKPSQENLEAVITELGELQLAELENFLRCNVPNLTPVEKIQDPHAAIIHTVLGENQLNIILKLPNKKLEFYPVSVSRKEVESTVEQLYLQLSKEELYYARQAANKVYDWLIVPIQAEINKAFPRPIVRQDISNVETSEIPSAKGTLVFVMDSVLRKTPLAFMRSRNKRYLIEDYAITLAPRQEVFQPSQSKAPLSIFVGGIGIRQPELEGESFTEIKFLEEELKAIKRIGLTTSEPLLDEEFTFDNIKRALRVNNYSAVHLKTHSQFSSNPNKTFIAAYKDKIHASDLRQIIKAASQGRGEPLDLLVLSACSSAEGDDRAILGLAGIATLTGTRSTISALWPAVDEFNTKFMEVFYTELVQGHSKAEALRRAQYHFMKRTGEPVTFWTNYILVGNWL